MIATTTITYAGGAPIRPFSLTDSYSGEHTAQHVRHPIIGGPPVFTLRPASPRAGTLRMLFSTEEVADDARHAHTLATVLTLVDDVRPNMGMTYVASGRIRLSLDPQTLTYWVLEVGYEAVS